MPSPVAIEDLTDPRLEPFREIRNRSWTERSGWFIAEGPLLVSSLLQSDYESYCFLLDAKFYERLRPQLPAEVEVLVADHGLMSDIVGFHFHRGILGCGLRKPKKTVAERLAARPFGDSSTLAACVGIQDPENLGAIMRSCAALGVEQAIIGPGCADPLGRRALRVAMGTTLSLTLSYSSELVDDLDHLHAAGIQSYATSLGSDALPLQDVRRRGTALVIFGNERYGLPSSVQTSAQHRIRIEMHTNIDSLNVGVAAGIILHYFARLAPASPVSYS